MNRVAGGLLVVAGAYVAYYGAYDLRLNPGEGTASDPIIDAAAVVQGWLSTAVDRVSAVPLVGVLALLVVGSVAMGRRRARSRPRV